jgi:hypothetical protein
MQHISMPFEREPENKKQAQGWFSSCLCLFLKVFLLYGGVPIATCLVRVGSHYTMIIVT